MNTLKSSEKSPLAAVMQAYWAVSDLNAALTGNDGGQYLFCEAAPDRGVFFEKLAAEGYRLSKKEQKKFGANTQMRDIAAYLEQRHTAPKPMPELVH